MRSSDLTYQMSRGLDTRAGGTGVQQVAPAPNGAAGILQTHSLLFIEKSLML